jgi:uncharacterized membrane protein YkvA (DUF1232 family)
MSKIIDFRQALVIFASVCLGVFALFYIMLPGDIIPDKAGLFTGPQSIIGWLDDAIVVIGAIFFLKHMRVLAFPKIKGKKKTNWSYLGFLVMLIAGAIWYLFWGADAIPDAIPYVGFFDDLMVFIGALKVGHKAKQSFKRE